MKYFISITLFLLLVSQAHTAKGPRHKSIRALSMGEAFVAVAEDKEAVYYNPAGLWWMNRLGNYDKLPELGYYNRNVFDARWNLGGAIPLSDALNVYRMGKEFETIISGATNSEGEGSQTAVLDSLAANSHMIDKLYRYDSKPIFIGTKTDFELAFHSFGGSVWADAGVAPFINGGVITPSAGLDTAYVNLVIQGAFAFSPVEQWTAGVGLKAAHRVYFPNQEISIMDFETIGDTIERKVDETVDNGTDWNRVGVALELGTQYQWKRDVRLGASLRDLFVREFDNQSITPDLTFGIAYSPRLLQRNTTYYRKFNLAADFADALNNDNNYKFFSHINMGIEVEQVLLAIPNIFWSGARFLTGRMAVGFKGGYPTFGIGAEILRIFHLDFATWADEGGAFTGQKEERYYLVQVGLGF